MEVGWWYSETQYTILSISVHVEEVGRNNRISFIYILVLINLSGLTKSFKSNIRNYRWGSEIKSFMLSSTRAHWFSATAGSTHGHLSKCSERVSLQAAQILPDDLPGSFPRLPANVSRLPFPWPPIFPPRALGLLLRRQCFLTPYHLLDDQVISWGQCGHKPAQLAPEDSPELRRAGHLQILRGTRTWLGR